LLGAFLLASMFDYLALVIMQATLDGQVLIAIARGCGNTQTSLSAGDDLGDLAVGRSLDPGYPMLQSTAAKYHEHDRRVDPKKRFPARPRRKRSTFFGVFPARYSDRSLKIVSIRSRVQPPGKPHGTHFPSVSPYPCRVSPSPSSSPYQSLSHLSD
jgi:hypothetical protein